MAHLRHAAPNSNRENHTADACNSVDYLKCMMLLKEAKAFTLDDSNYVASWKKAKIQGAKAHQGC